MSTAEERAEILANADFAGIGSHCDLDTCRQLDFLPFTCTYCKGTFCGKHRSVADHSCPKYDSAAAERAAAAARAASVSSYRPRPTSMLAGLCAATRCKININTATQPGVNCEKCRKQYCITHRLPDTHDCKPPSIPVMNLAEEKGKAALEWFKKVTTETKKMEEKTGGGLLGAFGVQKKPPPKTSVAAVMKMKKEAKGDEKVPVPKRVYVHVEAEARTATARIPRGVFWYSKEWKVGRVLDAAAKSLQVTNVNNQVDSDEKKLRIFHVEGGRVLEFNEMIGDIAVDGNTLVLMRGLQMPDLLEV
ncbi:hypothetical protein FPQ18DRAFT_334321 [Pyronema domesticum]|uniref:Similar to AN1-type zinc finger protein 1 acc. no. Q8TCF1 n=1 Tax=Pyronema omphalodes (strain CBS 100304) TaxID=1076935 RepID=U4L1R6_PYROM|nr:hypothetical protein FPQ18DRAFT_334321 [Pyronema domesticum]CCX06178.1 Similar to AN1-type zinc finger protein 1; acc. no. Q8TCF1 [Pyronema omphalodes CBS 100304]